jgi:hypothetical protein
LPDVRAVPRRTRGSHRVLNARYESVLQVMDELRRQGVQKVGLQVKTAS